MHVIKEGETFIVLDRDGAARGPGYGLFRRDTAYLQGLAWTVGESQSLLIQTVEQGLFEYRAIQSKTRQQLVGARRALRLETDQLVDCWTLTNSSDEPQTLVVDLVAEGIFADVFAKWVPDATVNPGDVERRITGHGQRLLSRRAADGVQARAEISLDPAPAGEAMSWNLTLQPGESRMIRLTVKLSADDDPQGLPPLPEYEDWRKEFPPPDEPEKMRAWQRAVNDLRLLLIPTEFGAYPAAGVPNFVNLFGRDALITAYMLLEFKPQLAVTVLRKLAAEQGRIKDPFREEEPGKIMHEMRRGELSRIGRIPFGRYFGSIDATPLFLILLDAYVQRTGNISMIHELAASWRAAVAFITAHQTSHDGLLTFAPSGSGLMVQSWKDSSDSMNHADGHAAKAPLAVAEVQGYGVAALRAAAKFEAKLGNSAAADMHSERAKSLAEAVHQRFWLEDLSSYAMALDADGKPLRVLSSDPGHLLWAGVVPAEIAPRLAATLLSPALWSGWGLRTLGTGEVRYNPMSYHNGSVWPHDTAIFGGGLARYGLMKELKQVADALFDLAESQPLHRLPELVAGFDRSADLAPVPYTHACRPQAWAAAALPYMVGLCAGAQPSSPQS